MPDYAAELEQLAQLKNQGILTEEEFEAKKKQILGIYDGGQVGRPRGDRGASFSPRLPDLA